MPPPTYHLSCACNLVTEQRAVDCCLVVACRFPYPAPTCTVVCLATRYAVTAARALPKPPHHAARMTQTRTEVDFSAAPRTCFMHAFHSIIEPPFTALCYRTHRVKRYCALRLTPFALCAPKTSLHLCLCHTTCGDGFILRASSVCDWTTKPCPRTASCLPPYATRCHLPIPTYNTGEGLATFAY